MNKAELVKPLRVASQPPYSQDERVAVYHLGDNWVVVSNSRASQWFKSKKDAVKCAIDRIGQDYNCAVNDSLCKPALIFTRKF